MSKLTNLDLEAYKKYNENFYTSEKYKNIKHHFKVHDIVRVNSLISHDTGFGGHLGIVQSLTGIDGYVYVFLYDKNRKKYVVCGFYENDLKEMSFKFEYLDESFKKAYLNYLEENFFKFAPDDFIREFKEIKDNKISLNNVIYVDFIKKTRI